MENASKALIISAEVLLGVILLTLMIFAFRAMGTFSDTVDKNIQMKMVSEFNAQFEPYKQDGKKDKITAQDIITMGNAAKQYNEQMGMIKIQVKITGVSASYQNAHKLDDETAYEFIKTYSTKTSEGGAISEIQYFTCTQMNYDKDTGKVNQIVLKKR